MHVYSVIASREGQWWMVRIPEIHGLTQALALQDVAEMAREYIAVTREIPLGEVALTITVR